ncbi:MAG: 30S ribosomal protein S18 [Planctomycetes bacterium]|nr:30S ribosomal protein S18 [Planctomycetota bacterium]
MRGRSFAKKRRRFEEYPTRFLYGNITSVDYKDVDLLGKLVTTYGKLLSRKSTGARAKLQRQITSAIKRAKFLALLPYLGTTVKD